MSTHERLGELIERAVTAMERVQAAYRATTAVEQEGGSTAADDMSTQHNADDSTADDFGGMNIIPPRTERQRRWLERAGAFLSDVEDFHRPITPEEHSALVEKHYRDARASPASMAVTGRLSGFYATTGES
jgi:hypothetical protein